LPFLLKKYYCADVVGVFENKCSIGVIKNIGGAKGSKNLAFFKVHLVC